MSGVCGECVRALCSRDSSAVAVDAPAVTRASLEAYARAAVLVLGPSVGRIEPNALLALPGLEAVVVDARSGCRPEECDCGKEGDAYRHVPVFRLDTARPPPVSLPDTLFKAGYPIPVLLHSAGAGAEVEVSDGSALTSTREGYEVRTLAFGPGEYTVGGQDMRVVAWDEGQAGCGIPRGAKRESVDLRIPYGVYAVGRDQYNNERRLRAVRTPQSLRVVGDGAFNMCYGLKTLMLTPGVKEIGSYAFKGTNILSLTIPGSVNMIGWRAFEGVGIQILALSEGLETIGDSAFSTNNMSEVCIPSSVTSIGSHAFDSCGKLHIITFSGNSKLETIREAAFEDSGLAAFTIPASIKAIEASVFRRCPLASLTSESTRFTMNNALIDEATKTLISFAVSETEYVVPCRVMKIGNRAFERCFNLTKIAFEEGCKLQEIGDYAFTGTGLKSFTIPRGVTALGRRVFPNVDSFTSVTFEPSSSLEIIGYDSFGGTNIMAVSIPPSVRQIKQSAFASCARLETVIFGSVSQLTKIGRIAFSGTNLRSIEIPKSVKIVGTLAFSSTPLETVTFGEGSELQIVGDYAFDGTKLTSITFPPTVESFGSHVFNGTTVSSITVPGTAKFDFNFLKGVVSSAICTVSFYHCIEPPHIFHNFNIRVQVC